jgi:cyclopropane fatty-acyl-phospholipid synthase-like methyltransferase
MSIVNRATHLLARVSRKIPVLGRLKRLVRPAYHNLKFDNSNEYWKTRYELGGNSGEGSYGKLAKYKAQFINEFVETHDINSVIEFGCGDGNQASLYKFGNFTGIDIVPACIEICKRRFSNRKFVFMTSDVYRNSQDKNKFDLSMSLDVVYHLVEDEAYFKYIDDVFSASSKYCLIYSSNFALYDNKVAHVKHRIFTEDVSARFPNWKLISNEKNPFEKSHDSIEYGSFASFYVFERLS